MAAKNKVKLTIGGTQYVVTSEESEAYMWELGRQLDSQMRDMLAEDGRVSTTMAAVLTALNNADGLRKATVTADNLRGQLKEYMDENARLRGENDRLRRDSLSRG